MEGEYEMNLRLLAVSILLLGMVAGAAFSAPSFLGYSGLISIPTTDALNDEEYSVGLHGLGIESGVDTTVYFANFGLEEGLEVGFTRFEPDSGGGETFVNAKYRIKEETEAHPAFAAGVTDFTGEEETTTYLVMSKSFIWEGTTRYGEINAPMLHLGVGGGFLEGIFGGVSVGLGDRILLMGEYNTSDYNFGVRLAVTPQVKVHAAVFDGDELGIGVSFSSLR